MKTEAQLSQLSEEERFTYLCQKACKMLGIEEDDVTWDVDDEDFALYITFPNMLSIQYLPFKHGYKFDVYGIGEIFEDLSGYSEGCYKPIIEKAVEHVNLIKRVAKLEAENRLLLGTRGLANPVTGAILEHVTD